MLDHEVWNHNHGQQAARIGIVLLANIAELGNLPRRTSPRMQIPFDFVDTASIGVNTAQ